MSTFTQKDILSHEARRVAMFFRAYKECSDEVRMIIDEMTDIICDETSEEDEREQAIDVIVEALFPSMNVEVVNTDDLINSSKEMRVARKILDREEKTFAERVRRLMNERNMTQENLAAAVGVSQPAIANILNRTCRPQRRTIAKFAEIFDTTPEALWPEYK